MTVMRQGKRAAPWGWLLASVLVIVLVAQVRVLSLASRPAGDRAGVASGAPTGTPMAGMALGSPARPATSGLGPQVDTSDTDLYVNRFIKRVVAGGDRHVMASGAWWGPPAKFAQNQLWVVAKGVQPGRSYRPGSLVAGTYTCLEPGKIAGHGTITTTLDYPTMAFNLGNHTPATAGPAGATTLERFHTFTVRALRSGSIEERYRCLSRDTAANPFGEARAPSRKGNAVRTNFDAMIWFGSAGSPQSANPLETGNHIGLPTTRTDLMDGHAWYSGGVEYDYSVPLNAADLFGKTVRGTITIQGFALACRHPTCSHTDATPIDVYHHALKIDINDKDYWVEPLYMRPATGAPLLATRRQKSLVTFTLVTRHVPDGWHILSYHMHVIDHRRVAGFAGEQLASEVKMPICVDNHHRSNC